MWRGLLEWIVPRLCPDLPPPYPATHPISAHPLQEADFFYVPVYTNLIINPVVGWADGPYYYGQSAECGGMSICCIAHKAALTQLCPLARDAPDNSSELGSNCLTPVLPPTVSQISTALCTARACWMRRSTGSSRTTPTGIARAGATTSGYDKDGWKSLRGAAMLIFCHHCS